MRLDRFLAETLLESRSDVKKYIRSGRILVNNEVIKQEATHVDTTLDIVTFDGAVLTYEEFQYFVINKPSGYVSANEDKRHPTIVEYASEFISYKLHTVGRLDKDTTGVILLTNDGKLTHRLISPKSATPKIYLATVDKPLTHDLITSFAEGFVINNEFKTLPAVLTIIDEKTARIEVIEGKFHQIKRMFAAFGYEVLTLHRESFAGIRALDLANGEYRKLSETELKLIKSFTKK